VTPTKPIWAPAGSGGGGGGASNYPANAVFSSIRTGTEVVSTIQSGSAPKLVDGQGNAITIAASALNIPGATTTISTLIVSSLNGAVPGGGGGSVGPNLTVSTLTALSSINSISSVTAKTMQADSFTGNVIAPNYNGNSYTPITIADPTDSDAAWGTLGFINGAAGDGDIQLTFTGYRTTPGGYRPQLIIKTQANASSNDLPCLITTAASQLAIENVSSINNLPYPPPPSASTVTTFNGAQQTGGFQAGYVANFPYASTLLFPYPYPQDKVAVVITPTNTGVSGGGNPDFSLNAGFGTNGVSSIGFSTDFRNGGVGATSDFYWMAYPWTN